MPSCSDESAFDRHRQLSLWRLASGMFGFNSQIPWRRRISRSWWPITIRLGIYHKYWLEIGQTLRIIQNTSNLGFGAAANRAFRQSKGKFLLLLNPDVRVKPSSIETLIATAEAHPKAGMVLPQLRNPDGSLQYSCRRFYTCGTLLLRRGPWKRFFVSHPKVRWHLMADWDHQSLAAVDWGLGAAALVRREARPRSRAF